MWHDILHDMTSHHITSRYQHLGEHTDFAIHQREGYPEFSNLPIGCVQISSNTNYQQQKNVLNKVTDHI